MELADVRLQMEEDPSQVPPSSTRMGSSNAEIHSKRHLDSYSSKLSFKDS